MPDTPRPDRPAALLGGVLTVVLTVALTLVVAVLPGSASAGAAARAGDAVGKADLLTLAEAGSVYDELTVESFRDVYYFGLTAPDFRTTPTLHCDRYRTYRGTSRVSGSYYTVKGHIFSVAEDVVQLGSGAEARALVRHYRDYVTTCRGTHATTDGEGGAAQQIVRGWHSRRVGTERVGVLEAFVQYGDVGWRRALVTRVGRTVVVVEVEPRRGTGSAKELTAITRLAVEKLG